MKTHTSIFLSLLAMAGAVTSTGCSNSPSSTAANNPNNMQELRVLDTKVVGKPSWTSDAGSAAVVEMKDGPLPANYVVVGLGQNRQITAVLETTQFTSHNFQGVKVLSGTLGKDDEVALPGGEYEVAVSDNVKNYLIQQNTTSNSKAPVGTANPPMILASQIGPSQN